MLVEFLKAWRCHKPGDKYDLPDGVANVLIRQKWAVEVKVEADPQITVKPTLPRPRREAAR